HSADLNQSCLSDLQSSHEEPTAASIALFIATIPLDSQYPASLKVLAAIRSFGKSAPSRFNMRVTAEVPLRCIPSTKIAQRGDVDTCRRASKSGRSCFIRKTLVFRRSFFVFDNFAMAALDLKLG